MPEGESPYLSSSYFPGFLDKHASCLQATYQSQHLQKQCQRMVGWVAISHYYNFPLLEFFYIKSEFKIRKINCWF